MNLSLIPFALLVASTLGDGVPPVPEPEGKRPDPEPGPRLRDQADEWLGPDPFDDEIDDDEYCRQHDRYVAAIVKRERRRARNLGRKWSPL